MNSFFGNNMIGVEESELAHCELQFEYFREEKLDLKTAKMNPSKGVLLGSKEVLSEESFSFAEQPMNNISKLDGIDEGNTKSTCIDFEFKDHFDIDDEFNGDLSGIGYNQAIDKLLDLDEEMNNSSFFELEVHNDNNAPAKSLSQFGEWERLNDSEISEVRSVSGMISSKDSHFTTNSTMYSYNQSHSVNLNRSLETLELSKSLIYQNDQNFKDPNGLGNPNNLRSQLLTENGYTQLPDYASLINYSILQSKALNCQSSLNVFDYSFTLFEGITSKIESFASKKFIHLKLCQLISIYSSLSINIRMTKTNQSRLSSQIFNITKVKKEAVQQIKDLKPPHQFPFSSEGIRKANVRKKLKELFNSKIIELINVLLNCIASFKVKNLKPFISSDPHKQANSLLFSQQLIEVLTLASTDTKKVINSIYYNVDSLLKLDAEITREKKLCLDFLKEVINLQYGSLLGMFFSSQMFRKRKKGSLNSSIEALVDQLGISFQDYVMK